jgi:hypothetical protein
MYWLEWFLDEVMRVPIALNEVTHKAMATTRRPTEAKLSRSRFMLPFLLWLLWQPSFEIQIPTERLLHQCQNSI